MRLTVGEPRPEFTSHTILIALAPALPARRARDVDKGDPKSDGCEHTAISQAPRGGLAKAGGRSARFFDD
jgi:hypothetical protein